MPNQQKESLILWQPHSPHEEQEKLPSVREMASKYAINPNTIARAYRKLEDEGYIYTLNGKGTFVAPNKQVNDVRRAELLKQFDEIVKELAFLMVPSEKLIERVMRAENDSGRGIGK